MNAKHHDDGTPDVIFLQDVLDALQQLSDWLGVAAEREADQIILSVTDMGPGIPADERERIFERFAQVTGDRRGYGLGLAFCRMAVEAHDGRIWVEPNPTGSGSRFVFSLPFYRTP